MTIDAERWQRLSPWLDEVLGLPAGQREAWLEELAAREATLAADLRSLLAGQAAIADAEFLDHAALPMAAALLAGQRIGAYTLLEPLGEGGMGSVWLAERSDGRFQGRAAIKLLHAGLLQRSLAARFRREGAILARLSHPHIARLVDAGLTEQGQPYLVLEHVAGERIDTFCDARRLDLRARLTLFGQVLQAVQHAHTQLVVHRDLKPGNVMVDAEGAVKLLDFGIAKLLEAEDAPAEATEITRDGGHVFSPQYAAPEQTRGDAVTTATDVYALGLLLYLLFTGQHPRVDAQGQHAMSAGELPLASRVVVDASRRGNDELQATAAARGTTPPRLAHALAGDLDNILAKALRADPVERYITVAAFAEDLRRHLEGQTVSARPDSLGYRVSRFVGRHRLGVGLAAAALAAIVGTAVVAEQQRREAVHERDLTAKQQAAAEAVAIFMEESLGQIGDDGRTPEPAALLDRAERRAQQLFFDAPEVMVRLHQHFWLVNWQLGRGPEMRRNFEAITAAAERIDDPVARAEASCIALRGFAASRNEEAIASIERTLADLPKLERSASVRWTCWFQKAELLYAAGRFQEAGTAYEVARVAAPPLFARIKEIPNTRARASVFARLGQPLAADQGYEQAGRLYELAGRGRSLAMAYNLSSRSALYSGMGRPRESLAFAEQAVAMARSSRGGAALPFNIAARAAFEYGKLGRDADALRLYEEVLLRGGRLEPPDRRFWSPVARAHQLRGEHVQAVEVLERSIATNKAEGYGLYEATGLLSLADILFRQGQADRSLAALDALDSTAASQTFRHESRWMRARALNIAGRPAEAEAAARDAAAQAQRLVPSGMRSTLHGEAHLELARALAALGKADEARSAAQRAADEFGDAVGPDHRATRAALALARR